jgi:hypothetical protein
MSAEQEFAGLDDRDEDGTAKNTSYLRQSIEGWYFTERKKIPSAGNRLPGLVLTAQNPGVFRPLSICSCAPGRQQE